jgi:beta-glucosidase
MKFPDDFVWGVASSSFQIEGDVAGRGACVWDRFCETPGKVFNGDDGFVACDHVRRYREDVDLIAGLGVGAYRFSVSWTRVCPDQTGGASESGLGFYDRLVDALLERGVEPWVTLYHWDHPQWAEDLGGWRNREIVERFGAFVEAVVDRLSDRVSRWMTLNEPQIFVGYGLIEGRHAPGLKLPRRDSLQAAHHVLLAHGQGVRAIRAGARKPAQVGWAVVGDVVYPQAEDAASVEAARALTMRVREPEGNWAFCNTWFGDAALLGRYPEDALAAFGSDGPTVRDGDMELIAQPVDFLGLNIYSGVPGRAGDDGPEVVGFGPGHARTAIGWAVTPEAVYWGPKFLGERYGLPLYITENGLASMDWVHLDGTVPDHARIDFLTRYLREIQRAIADGVDIRGYFHWSILDNFEWGQGYQMRFGLVHVDFETQKRTRKASYEWYRRAIRGGGEGLFGTSGD